MDNFSPLSMRYEPILSRHSNSLYLTKLGAKSEDFGLKYYFCGRLSADRLKIRATKRTKKLIWQEIEHLQ